jgi:hypothetical protein
MIDNIIRTENLKPNERVVFSEIHKINHPSDIVSPHLLYRNEPHNERSMSDKFLDGSNVFSHF